MGPKMHVFEGKINQIHDSISRHMICEVCKKTSLKSPTVADTIYIPLKGGHHRQLNNQCKDPIDNDKDCRVGQLTNSADECWLAKMSIVAS